MKNENINNISLNDGVVKKTLFFRWNFYAFLL